MIQHHAPSWTHHRCCHLRGQRLWDWIMAWIGRADIGNRTRASVIVVVRRDETHFGLAIAIANTRVGLRHLRVRVHSSSNNTNRGPPSNGNDDDDNDHKQLGSQSRCSLTCSALLFVGPLTLCSSLSFSTQDPTLISGGFRSYNSIPNANCPSTPVPSIQTYFSSTSSSTQVNVIFINVIGFVGFVGVTDL